MTDAETAALHANAKRLVALLDDRHEGLFTWNTALNSVLARISTYAPKEDIPVRGHAFVGGYVRDPSNPALCQICLLHVSEHP